MIVNGEIFHSDFFPSEQTISENWCFLIKSNVLFLIKIVTLE